MWQPDSRRGPLPLLSLTSHPVLPQEQHGVVASLDDAKWHSDLGLAFTPLPSLAFCSRWNFQEKGLGGSELMFPVPAKILEISLLANKNIWK